MMAMRVTISLASVAGATALHEHQFNASTTGGCIAPGICSEPSTQYKRVMVGPKPGQQWNIDGGFCGAFSTQQSAMAHGAWISQDLVRKANKDDSGNHDMHGDTRHGYELLPSNAGYTAQQLKLSYDEFDYTQAQPQAAAYKKWLKGHLVQGHPVVWFPMCKGDSHNCYGGGPCPGGGHVDHIEPVFGIFSEHPLSDDTVYDDDWILHASDQDLQPYYRKMSTLEDSSAMQGNCLDAQPGFGFNEMYPCIDEQVTYGLAITGLAVEGALPLTLEILDTSEPNVRTFHWASDLRGTVTASGLRAGGSYILYRYGSTGSLPSAAPFTDYEAMTAFTAEGSTWTYEDPETFRSDSATYYVAVEAAGSVVV